MTTSRLDLVRSVTCDVQHINNLPADIKKVSIKVSLVTDFSKLSLNDLCSYSISANDMRWVPKDARTISSFGNIMLSENSHLSFKVYLVQMFTTKTIAKGSINIDKLFPVIESSTTLIPLEPYGTISAVLSFESIDEDEDNSTVEEKLSSKKKSLSLFGFGRKSFETRDTMRRTSSLSSISSVFTTRTVNTINSTVAVNIPSMAVIQEKDNQKESKNELKSVIDVPSSHYSPNNRMIDLYALESSRVIVTESGVDGVSVGPTTCNPPRGVSSLKTENEVDFKAPPVTKESISMAHAAGVPSPVMFVSHSSHLPPPSSHLPPPPRPAPRVPILMTLGTAVAEEKNDNDTFPIYVGEDSEQPIACNTSDKIVTETVGEMGLLKWRPSLKDDVVGPPSKNVTPRSNGKRNAQNLSVKRNVLRRPSIGNSSKILLIDDDDGTNDGDGDGNELGSEGEDDDSVVLQNGGDNKNGEECITLATEQLIDKTSSSQRHGDPIGSGTSTLTASARNRGGGRGSIARKNSLRITKGPRTQSEDANNNIGDEKEDINKDADEDEEIVSLSDDRTLDNQRSDNRLGMLTSPENDEAKRVRLNSKRRLVKRSSGAITRGSSSSVIRVVVTPPNEDGNDTGSNHTSPPNLTLEELPSYDNHVYDDFATSGTGDGVEMWVLDTSGATAFSAKIVKLSFADFTSKNVFYPEDCYLVLKTDINDEDIDNVKYTWGIHTWVGNGCTESAVTEISKRAAHLKDFLKTDTMIMANVQDDVSNTFKTIFGDSYHVASYSTILSQKDMLERNISKIRLLKKANKSARSSATSNRRYPSLLLTNPSHSEESGNQSLDINSSFEVVPLLRHFLHNTGVFILDSGEGALFQWRGEKSDHILRAEVFDYALQLRAERMKMLKLNTNECKIEVVDEGKETKEFWTVFDMAIADKQDEEEKSLGLGDSKDDNSLSFQRLAKLKSNSNYDKKSLSVSCDSPDSKMNVLELMRLHSSYSPQTPRQIRFEDNILINADKAFEHEYYDESDEESSKYEFHMKDLKKYCKTQCEAHLEMIRRRVQCRSRVITTDNMIENYDTNSIIKSSQQQKDNTTYANMYKLVFLYGELKSVQIAGTSSSGKYIGPLKKSLLESKGVYIIDHMQEVYVWMGHISSVYLRSAAMAVAKTLIKEDKSDHVVAVSVLDGNEPYLFRTKFSDWLEVAAEPAPKTHPSHSKLKKLSSFSPSSGIIVLGNDKSPRKHVPMNSLPRTPGGRSANTETMVCKSLISNPVEIYEDDVMSEILLNDSGDGVSIVYILTSDDKLTMINAEQHGHFWSHESYVVLYGYNYNDYDGNAVTDFVIYYWEGSHSNEKAYFRYKSSIFPAKKMEWKEQMGKIPYEVKIYQGSEPFHFLKIFKYQYIFHFGFLTILKERNLKEKSVEKIQSNILQYEKKQTTLSSPRQYSLRPASLSMAKTSENRSKEVVSAPIPTFKSLDSSLAEYLITKNSAVKIPRAVFHQELTSGVLLFHVRGHGVMNEDVHAVQIEAQANRLNSSDCYIAIRPLVTGEANVWLWVGRGSLLHEQITAGTLATRLLRWVGASAKSQIRVVEEGIGLWINKWTARSFYRALGGYNVYCNYDLLQTAKNLRPKPLQYAQLFVCNIVRKDYVVSIIRPRFSQKDLSPTIGVILDAHFAVFVWYGRDCSGAMRSLTRHVADHFLGRIHNDTHLLKRNPIEVEQDNEPPSFMSCFHGWCEWSLLDKKFVDPRDVRCNVRKKLGLMGDMASVIGRPVFLSAEERESIKKYKNSQQKIINANKKETPKSSLREKLRCAAIEAQHANTPHAVKKHYPIKHVSSESTYIAPVRTATNLSSSNFSMKNSLLDLTNKKSNIEIHTSPLDTFALVPTLLSRHIVTNSPILHKSPKETNTSDNHAVPQDINEDVRNEGQKYKEDSCDEVDEENDGVSAMDIEYVGDCFERKHDKHHDIESLFNRDAEINSIQVNESIASNESDIITRIENTLVNVPIALNGDVSDNDEKKKEKMSSTSSHESAKEECPIELNDDNSITIVTNNDHVVKSTRIATSAVHRSNSNEDACSIDASQEESMAYSFTNSMLDELCQAILENDMIRYDMSNIDDKASMGASVRSNKDIDTVPVQLQLDVVEEQAEDYTVEQGQAEVIQKELQCSQVADVSANHNHNHNQRRLEEHFQIAEEYKAPEIVSPTRSISLEGSQGEEVCNSSIIIREGYTDVRGSVPLVVKKIPIHGDVSNTKNKKAYDKPKLDIHPLHTNTGTKSKLYSPLSSNREESSSTPSRIRKFIFKSDQEKVNLETTNSNSLSPSRSTRRPTPPRRQSPYNNMKSSDLPNLPKSSSPTNAMNSVISFFSPNKSGRKSLTRR